MLRRISRYLREEIWRLPRRRMSRRAHMLIRPLRILTLSIRGFAEDRCMLRASALTFYSLLSVVPMLAMLFVIARGFGMEEDLGRQLRTTVVKMAVGIDTERTNAMASQMLAMDDATSETRVSAAETATSTDTLAAGVGKGKQAPDEVVLWMNDVMDRVIAFAHEFLQHTHSGILAFVGIGILLWTVIAGLGHIENAFNDIWGIVRGRSFKRKASSYLSIIVVTVFLNTSARTFVEHHNWMQHFGGFVAAGMSILPYLFLWFLLTLLYSFMPNTRVSWQSSVLAALVAGTIYQGLQLLYIHMQGGLNRYNAIYGSFAALPLFIIWLQVSWGIVLFGAEVSFAVDNEETFEFECDCTKASQRFRRLLALRAVQLCIEKFCKGEEAPTAVEIARHLECPIRLMRSLLQETVQAHVLAETTLSEEGDVRYLPACSGETMTIWSVVDALQNAGTDGTLLVRSGELDALAGSWDAMIRAFRSSPDNVKLVASCDSERDKQSK
jgi:membrane protein